MQVCTWQKHCLSFARRILHTEEVTAQLQRFWSVPCCKMHENQMNYVRTNQLAAFLIHTHTHLCKRTQLKISQGWITFHLQKEFCNLETYRQRCNDFVHSLSWNTCEIRKTTASANQIAAFCTAHTSVWKNSIKITVWRS